ncbi:MULTISPECIES: alpha/beta hydrolase [unclassified Actinobaculum]|uniref:alpha/beta fold hydrolase n=1 Tax=unclassified Actinobaculum TaxID=2609299 RepID=UPI000D529C19|nr:MULTISPECIES: alpha/beta hydrolase [unclassified Actinobaculum]AWE41776.1 alpha/beta hydrolase [Actinobaculum sp. 313]RTE50305.1 alpha/beta hydrolase [Actinobaculum sp. 352]
MTTEHGQSNRTVVFLHGMGEGPEAWDAQAAALPAGFTGLALPVFGTRDADMLDFTLSGAVRALVADLDQRGLDVVDVCGLSLGAMVATQFAIDHPQRVRSLVLSGSQTRPNPILMKLQNALIRVAGGQIAPEGMSKARLRQIVHELARIDTREAVTTLSAPTLIMCGTRDRPNLPASRLLARLIPGAQLQIVPGAVHVWNTQKPEEFSRRINEFFVDAIPTSAGEA